MAASGPGNKWTAAKTHCQLGRPRGLYPLSACAIAQKGNSTRSLKGPDAVRAASWVCDSDPTVSALGLLDPASSLASRRYRRNANGTGMAHAGMTPAVGSYAPGISEIPFTLVGPRRSRYYLPTP